MHEVEAATITSDKLAGQEDVSKCLPGWIRTMCNAFEKGEGYTLSHSAVSALAHTLICARVRAERLVRERDEAREKNWADHYFRQWQEAQEQLKKLRSEPEADRLRALLTEIAEYAHENSTGPTVPDALWEIRQMAYEIPTRTEEVEQSVMASGTKIVFIRATVHANASDLGVIVKHDACNTYRVQCDNRPEFFRAVHGIDFIAV
jgi:hypothetical protein